MIPSIGIAGITTHIIILHGIIPLFQCHGDGEDGTHPITVGDGGILTTPVTGTDLTLIMDGDILIITDMVDITEGIITTTMAEDIMPAEMLITDKEGLQVQM